MSEKASTILLVDDEPDILEFLSYNLQKEGYEVSKAGSGQEALEKVRQHVPDLVVLDVMMPEMDGVETCIQMRELSELRETVIAFLTARSEDYTQIAGLEAGADDYITKPIKPRVFVSKVKSLLRRRGESKSEDRPAVSGLRIDREKYVVIRDGEEISLPKKEFELLDLLMSKPGKVFTREEILSRIWGDDIIVGDRTIDVHIRKLREKVGDTTIKTIKGVGYKIEQA